MQHAAEASHIERIICPRQLIGTFRREFDRPLPFFFFCDSDCVLGWIDGSDALRASAVKKFESECAVAAADIDQTFIANAYPLQSSFRHSLIRVAAAQRCIGRVKIAAVTAYIRAKRFDSIPIRHPHPGWFDHRDAYIGLFAIKYMLPNDKANSRYLKPDVASARRQNDSNRRGDGTSRKR